MKNPIPNIGRWADGSKVDRSIGPSIDIVNPLEIVVQVESPDNLLYVFIADNPTDLLVDWGDLQSESTTDVGETEISHEYAESGIYHIKISGYATRISFSTITSNLIKEVRNSLRSVIGINSCNRMFAECPNLNKVSPTLLRDIGLNITDMGSMFENSQQVEVDTTEWQTNNVTDMSYMFKGCLKVKPRTRSWNTGKVVDMSYMFSDAELANPDVTYWNTSSVQDMSNMFSGAVRAKPNTRNWNTSNVTDMSGLFANTLLADPDVSLWDMSHTSIISGMFYNARNANPNVKNWDTSNITLMNNTFKGAIKATPNVTNWNVENVVEMQSLFDGAVRANPNVTNWDTASLTHVDYMFRNTSSMTRSVPKSIFMKEAIVSKTGFISDSRSNSRHQYPLSWGGSAFLFSVRKTTPGGFTYSFNIADPVDLVIDWGDGSGREDITLTGPVEHTYESNGTYVIQLLNGDASKISFDTEYSEYLYRVYSSVFKFENVDSFEDMFSGCISLNWITPKFTDILSTVVANPILNFSGMFRNCFSLNTDVSNWNVSSATDMHEMFDGAAIFKPNVKNWDVSSVTDMSYMFRNTWEANPDVSSWSTDSLKNTTGMFSNAGGANPNVANWFVENLTHVSQMFYMASSMTNAIPAAKFWDRAEPFTEYEDMCLDAEGISNYNSIPRIWGGPAFTAIVQYLPSGSFTFAIISDKPTDLTIDWGDGNRNTYNSESLNQTHTHIYEYSGTYRIRMYGSAERISFSTAYAALLKQIKYRLDSITDIVSCQNMFLSCSNLEFISDDFFDATSSNVTILRGMFRGALKANPNTTNWDVSKVISFYETFKGAVKATPDTSQWVLNSESNITMFHMFSEAILADPDVSNWDTTKVTNLEATFRQASNANPDVSGWNTENVTTMRVTFQEAHKANPDVSLWNTSNVLNMRGIFDGAILANPNVSNWDVSKVVDMGMFFRNARSATSDVSGFDTSDATIMEHMFNGAILMNPDVRTWNMTKVTTVASMFKDCVLVDYYINPKQFIDNPTITTHTDCFSGATNIPNILYYPTSWGGLNNPVFVATNEYIPEGSYTFGFKTDKPTELIIDWGDGEVETITSENLNVAPTHIYTSNGTHKVRMWGAAERISFYTAYSPLLTAISGDLIAVSGINSFLEMFRNCTNLATIGDTCFDTTSGNVTTFKEMFYSATIAQPNTSNWNTSKVTIMSSMFRGTSLANPDVSNWDTSNVASLNYMFYGTLSAAPDTSNWVITNKLLHLGAMFRGAKVANPYTRNWDVSSVTSAFEMFRNTDLANPDVSLWRLSNNTSLFAMFSGAKAANPDVSDWDMRNVGSIMQFMQNAISANPDLSKWDMPNMVGCQNAFDGCISMTNPVPAEKFWNNPNMVDFINCFKNCPLANRIDVPYTWGGPGFQVKISYELAESFPYSIIFDEPTQLYINWGDGVEENKTGTGTQTYSHVYATGGDYVISMSGTPIRVAFNTAHADRLKEVITPLKPSIPLVNSCYEMFKGCTNLDTIVPTFLDEASPNIENLRFMFDGAILANPDVSRWDTSNVSGIYAMFQNAASATPDTSGWVINKVTSFSYVFNGATLANPDVSTWDPTNVSSFVEMFRGAINANPDVSLWNTQNLTNCFRMFNGATSANPNVSNWNTSKLSNISRMFSSATSANPDISNWNTSALTNTSYAFWGATGMTNPVPALWDDPDITTYTDCFTGAVNIRNSYEIPSSWGGDPKYAVEIFYGLPESFTLAFIVTNPVNFVVDWGDGSSDTYNGAGDQTLSHVYATGGTYIVKSVGGLTGIKYNTARLTKILTPFGYSLTDNGITSFQNVFYGCSNLISVHKDVFRYNTGATSFWAAFRSCSKLEFIHEDIFRYNIEAENFLRCFQSCSLLKQISENLFKYNVKMNTLANGFNGCIALEEIPENLFKYNPLLGFESTFYTFTSCRSLTFIPAELFRHNPNIITFKNTFQGCIGLTTIPEDLFRYQVNAGWDAFNSTFAGCTELVTVPELLFKYNTLVNGPQAFNYTFYGCKKLKLNPWIFYANGEQSTRFAGKNVSFLSCFDLTGATPFIGEQGQAPDLWNCTFGSVTRTDCFKGHTVDSLSNYATIPNNWKGL